jgi:DNA-binding NtrC family response regulator
MSHEGQISVLVVDDEPAIAESLAEYLEDFDMSVVTAGNAAGAMEALDEGRFHVAVIDLRLPDLNGESLILKVAESHRHLRFIIHTGSVDFRLSPELAAHGIAPEHVFLKPQADLSALAEAVRTLARRGR